MSTVLTKEEKHSTIPTTRKERQQLLRDYKQRKGRGLLQVISRRVRRDSGQVNRVFHGFSPSARIRRAIERELARTFGAAQGHLDQPEKRPIMRQEAQQGNGSKRSGDERSVRHP